MVVDASAVVAIFLTESDHEPLTETIDLADTACMSIVSRFEVFSVLCGARVGAQPEHVSSFLESLRLEIVPVSNEQGRLAIDTLFRYGRGRHPAKLNLGDCFAYALAKERGEALLFKGDEFALTDVEPAWRPGPDDQPEAGTP